MEDPGLNPNSPMFVYWEDSWNIETEKDEDNEISE
jgi:hypothetical protein